MDFENNGQDATNFMSKIKKQAKRLFQLSKKQANTLEVSNLSKAQEIIAQLNGYPDWHALEKHISAIGKSSKQMIIKNNQNQINFESEQNVYFNKEDDCLISYLRINSLPSDIETICDKLTWFNDLFSFQLNMGIHTVDIIGEQLNKTYEPNKEYLLFQISQDFKISEEEVKRLFLIDNSSAKILSNNDLTLYFMIRTPIKYKEEHINICLSMLSSMSYGNTMRVESVPYIQREQWKKFQFKEYAKNNNDEERNINFSLFGEKYPNVLNIKKLVVKWIYLLNFLQSKQIDFTFKVSLLDKKIIYTFNEKDKELINAFIQSIIKTSNFIEQEFKYLAKPNFNYIEEKTTKGLYLKSLLHNKLFNYVSDSSSRTTHIDFIYGKPGAGKGLLNSLMTLSLIMNKDIKEMPNLGIIDVGLTYQEMLNLIKNSLPEAYQNKIIQFNLENSIEYSINPFDLPLGKRRYDDDDMVRIAQVLLPLFSLDKLENENINYIESYLSNAVAKLNKLPEKLYDIGIEKEIDHKLEQLNYAITKKTSWCDIVDILFLNGEEQLAENAQRHAVFTLVDLLLVQQEINIIYEKVNMKTGETIGAYVRRIITERITTHPWLNKPTQLDISDAKIVYFNLDKVCSFKDISIQNYWLNLALNLIKTKVVGFNAYTMERKYPNNWTEDWKTYLEGNSLETVYDYYNYKKYYKGMNFNRIIIDEYHRFSNPIINNQILNLTRESRKNNTGITLLSQLAKDLIYFKHYVSGLFVSNINTNEERELGDIFDKNELALMKKVKYTEWAVKIITNRGYMFDIIKLEVPSELALALSTTSEDIFAKNKLTETIENNSYFNGINKLQEFLNKNNIRSFKQIGKIEFNNNQDKEPEDIVKILKELDAKFD